MDLQKQIDAEKALDFLRNHPALHNESGDSICDGMWFGMYLCCKHGTTKYSEHDGVTVWHGDEGWEKYKDLFDAQNKEDAEDETPLELRSVKVPYIQYYGEPWVADHMEYWYETTFSVFCGNPYDKIGSWDLRNWQRYGGPEGGANTFEDMLIEVAKEVKDAYGDWGKYGEFHTPEETLNHKKVEAITFVDCDRPHFKEVLFNKDHVDISDGLINLRWLEWYMTTDHAKKHWECSFPEWTKYINDSKVNEPEERKTILARYR